MLKTETRNDFLKTQSQTLLTNGLSMFCLFLFSFSLLLLFSSSSSSSSSSS